MSGTPTSNAMLKSMKLMSLDPRLRRACMCALAVTLSGLAILSQRSPRQVVAVHHQGQLREYSLAVDSAELDSLRKVLARRSLQTSSRKPDAYYHAQWRMQAAAFYLSRCQRRGGQTAAAAAAPGDSVVQASFPAAESSAEEALTAAHWAQQYALAQRTLESIAAALPKAADAQSRQPSVRFGPVVAAAPTPAEILLLLALGIGSGLMYVRLARPRPAKLLLHTSQQVRVQADWVSVRRDRHEWLAKRLDQAGWVMIATALLTILLG